MITNDVHETSEDLTGVALYNDRVVEYVSFTRKIEKPIKCKKNMCIQLFIKFVFIYFIRKYLCVGALPQKRYFFSGAAPWGTSTKRSCGTLGHILAQTLYHTRLNVPNLCRTILLLFPQNTGSNFCRKIGIFSETVRFTPTFPRHSRSTFEPESTFINYIKFFIFFKVNLIFLHHNNLILQCEAYYYVCRNPLASYKYL